MSIEKSVAHIVLGGVDIDDLKGSLTQTLAGSVKVSVVTKGVEVSTELGPDALQSAMQEAGFKVTGELSQNVPVFSPEGYE